MNISQKRTANIQAFISNQQEKNQLFFNPQLNFYLHSVNELRKTKTTVSPFAGANIQTTSTPTTFSIKKINLFLPQKHNNLKYKNL